MVNNSETKIDRKKGLKDQNGEWEDYFERMNPDARRLRPGSKGFDHVKDATGEAISNKTLNRLSVTYIRDPREIYRKVTRYADNTINYERLRNLGLILRTYSPGQFIWRFPNILPQSSGGISFGRSSMAKTMAFRF